MFEELNGKRLLFLGGILPYCEAIEFAKSCGVYTVVTDYLIDSPAKKVADKSYLVSTTDVEGVVEICKKEHIDGLFVAFMDHMLPYAKKICEIMGYPFYASDEQIRLTLDKKFFKKICAENGIPVPKSYMLNDRDGYDSKVIEYPVIVKPADSNQGKGVTVCKSPHEFKQAYDFALKYSPSKSIVVEEYVKGQEFTATYTMKDGEISFSCMKDKLLCEEHENITAQTDAYVMPSAYLDDYLQNVNPFVIEMLRNVRATDGTVFFQGIANPNKITLFELGYRPGGVCDYRYIERVNHINLLKMMIAYSLTGKMGGFDLALDNPYFKGKTVVVYTLWAHAGVIAEQYGIEAVLKQKNVVQAEYKHDVGFEITEDGSLKQYVFRAIIIDEDIDRIKNTINVIQSAVKVKDQNGNSMLYNVPFNSSRLDCYAKK